MQFWTVVTLKLLAWICVSAHVLSKASADILHISKAINPAVILYRQLLTGSSRAHLQSSLLAVLVKQLDIGPPQPGLVFGLGLLTNAQLPLVFLHYLRTATWHVTPGFQNTSLQ